MKKIKYLLIIIFLLPLSLLAQQTTISGKVIDLTDGSILPGVSVQIKGTTTGTMTDIGGTFHLTVSNSNPVLLLSYTGYENQEIAARAQTKFAGHHGAQRLRRKMEMRERE